MRALAALVTCLVACGGDAAWLPDDLDEQATLDALGDAAVGRACGAFEDYLLDQWRDSYLVEAVCTVRAIEATENADACGDAIQACTGEPPPEVRATVDAILAQASCEALDVTSTGCAATLGALAACLDAFEAEVAALRLTATCAAAGQPVEPSWSLLDTPAACMALEVDC